MITKLDIFASQGNFLSLPMRDSSSGFIVEEIEGLDPVKATLVSSSFAQQDGSQYQSSRRESRNIKLRLGLEPDWAVDTVQSLRSRLYSVLMPKTEVNMKFLMENGLDVDIKGRVESLETPHFVKEPAVDASIMCFDPDFVDLDPVLINGQTTAGSTMQQFNYAGTVETGILFKLMVNRAMTAFTIYHQAADGSLRTLEFAAPLVSGDIITISTVNGNKYATRTRGGSDTSILFGVSPQSNWIELKTGANQFRVYATGNPVPFTFQYLNRYGGL